MKPLVGSSVTVCPKVRLTDVFSLPKDIKGRQALWNRISQKHVDFVLCDAATMKPLFAVELDDSSHKFEKAKARDEFVNRVFADASLPLLRFPAKRGYKTAEIAAQLAPYVTGQPVAASPIEPIVSVPVSSAEPCCPKCGKLMVIRTANKGAHAGEQFYACSGYPQCKTTLPLSQATVLQQ